MPSPYTSGPALNTRARASLHSSTTTTEMSDTLKPPHFQGKALEDAASWLDQLECYLIFKKVDEAQKAPGFSLLLDGSARTWYESLPTATKRDYGALVDAFKQRYCSKSAQWKDVGSIFSRKQTEGESLLDFIADMRRMAMKVQLPDQQTLQAILNGVDPTYRPFLLQQKPEGLQQLECIAQTLEGSYTPPVKAKDNAESALIQAITDMRLEISTLNTRINSVAVASTQSSYQRQGYWERDSRNRTPSPGWKRERSANPHWSERRDRSASPTWKDGRNNRPTSPYRKQVSFNSQRQYGACKSCGEYHNRSTCSARNATCYTCNRVGHIAKVCMQAKFQNSSNRD